MSSAIIKMKRGSETDLAEVSKSILDDFKGCSFWSGTI